MGKAPAFQFYAADFLIGTVDFTLAELGAYVKLLALSWDKGPLPLDEERRARWLGVSVKDMRRLWTVVGDKWVQIDDGYVNLRLEQQRADREAYVQKQAEKGKRSGESRRKEGTTVEPRLNHGSFPVRTKDEPNTNSSSSSSDHDPHEDRSDRVSRDRDALPPVWRPAGPRRAEKAQRDLSYCLRHCPTDPPWAIAACNAGICIAKYDWQKWQRRKTPQQLQAFVEKWTPLCTGGDKPEKFWPAAFEAEFGTSRPSPPVRDKATQANDAMHEALAIINADFKKAIGDGTH